jgi:hypothetical protein
MISGIYGMYMIEKNCEIFSKKYLLKPDGKRKGK